MADKLISADALLKRICELCGENCEMPNEAVTCVEWEFAHDAIESLPTVDAVPVVRCKDCKYAYMTYGGECKYCDMWEEEGEMYLDGDFYCAFGKRKEDAKIH